MQRNRSVLFLLAFLFALPLMLAAQGQKMLTYDQAFNRAEPRLMGMLPRIERWLDGENWLESRVDPARRTQALYKVNARTGEEALWLDLKELGKDLPEGFSLDPRAEHDSGYTRFILNKDNDLWYFDAAERGLKQLTENKAEEKTPILSPDGKKVAFTRDHDLYMIDIASGIERRLTFDGSETILNGWASWVYMEEILGRMLQYRAFWWSPNSEMIAFMRFDDAQVPEFTLVKADGAHGEVELQRYPKAGDPNPEVRIGVVHLASGLTTWVDTDPFGDRYAAWPMWTPDSRQLFFQWMNRGQDHLILYSANPQTGVKKSIYEKRRPTWVEFFETIHFFEDNSGFLLVSEEKEWDQIFHYSIDGRLIKQLTREPLQVKDIVLVDEKAKTVWFHGTDGDRVQKHLYKVGLNGGGLKKLTGETGSHTCSVAPGGAFFTDNLATLAQPTRLILADRNGKLLRQLGDQKLPALDEYLLGTSEIFTIPSGDGYDLPARWILPPAMEKTRKYPVIFQVYGGPGAPIVRYGFPMLNDLYMAQKGVIILYLDHRGSGYNGRKGMDAMHRSLGKWEIHDYIAAVKWLKQLSFVDSTRIGITGGSYGGYVTLLAMTAGADYFTHGVAEYSVTDYRLYDSIYTERYMDTPEENPDGYTAGSVMTHAEKLEGKLLITHGTMDDNVHMQNILQLIDKLQDLDKDFSLMIYPNQRHGIGGPKRKHVTRLGYEFIMRGFGLEP